jgi:hypothetical protein
MMGDSRSRLIYTLHITDGDISIFCFGQGRVQGYKYPLPSSVSAGEFIAIISF